MPSLLQIATPGDILRNVYSLNFFIYMAKIEPEETIIDEKKGIIRMKYDFDPGNIRKLHVHGPIVVKSDLTVAESFHVPIALKDQPFMKVDWDEEHSTLDIRADREQMKQFETGPVLIFLHDFEAYEVLADDGALIQVNGDCKLQSVTLKGGSYIFVSSIFYSNQMNLMLENSSASFHGLIADQLNVQATGKTGIDFKGLSARDCDFTVSDQSRISANGMAFTASVKLYNQSVVDISHLLMNMIAFSAFGQSTLKYHAEWEEKTVSEGCSYQNFNQHANDLDSFRVEQYAYKELLSEEASLLMVHLLLPDASQKSHTMKLVLSYDKQKRVAGRQFFAAKSYIGEKPILLFGDTPNSMKSYDASRPFKLASILDTVLQHKMEDVPDHFGKVLVSVSPGDLDGEAIPDIVKSLESIPEQIYEGVVQKE